MRRLSRNTFIVAVMVCLFQTKLYAANPSTSTISITIPALVQISGLNDISLSPTSFSSSVTGNTTACIYTNNITPLGSYFITASSVNVSGGAFRVTSGGKFITYSAFWNSTSSSTPTTALSSGTKTTQQLGGNSAALNCGGVANANFNVSFSAAQVTGASPATYTDTVTLVVSPS